MSNIIIMMTNDHPRDGGQLDIDHFWEGDFLEMVTILRMVTIIGMGTILEMVAVSGVFTILSDGYSVLPKDFVKLQAKSSDPELTLFYPCYNKNNKNKNPHQNLSEGGVLEG